MDLVTYFEMIGFACLVGIWHLPAIVKVVLAVIAIRTAVRFTLIAASSSHRHAAAQAFASPGRHRLAPQT